MKRIVIMGGVAVGVALVTAVATLGPNLWNGYRFMEKVEQSADRYQANGGAWPQLQDNCAFCHGARGQASNARYPSLAGLGETYLEEQLHAFAEGRRTHPQMEPLAASLSDDQVKLLATYYQRQIPAELEGIVIDAQVEQRGRELVSARGCAACHERQLTGGPRAPRLAGQGEAYLANQLLAYKQGSRQDPTQAMNGISLGLTEEDIVVLAHYLASLVPAEPQDRVSEGS